MFTPLYNEISSTGGAKLTVSGSTTLVLGSNLGGSGTTDIMSVVKTGENGTLDFIAPGNASNAAYGRMAVYVQLNLGGTSASPVGSIVLKKQEGSNPAVLRLPNNGKVTAGDTSTEGSASSGFDSSYTSVTQSATITLKGDGGKLKSIAASANSSDITNTNTETDFVICSTTLVQ